MSETSKLENGDSTAYWAGILDRKLLFQKCLSCGHVQFPPRHHCGNCWQASPEWVRSCGTGTLESFTIVRRVPTPAFRGKVPYVAAAVKMAEGPRMIATLVGDNAMDVTMGETVTVDFAEEQPGLVLPVFRRC